MKEKSGSSMAVKKKLGSFLSSVWAKRLGTVLLCFVLAAVTASAAIMPGSYPFGVAMTAAASGITATLASMAGALVGSATLPAGGAYVIMIAALTLCRLFLSRWLSRGEQRSADEVAERIEAEGRKERLTAFLKKLRESPGRTVASFLSAHTGGTMLRENIRIRMALSACAALFAGAWSVVAGGYGQYDLLGAVFSLVTTPLVTYLFYVARDRKMRSSHLRELAVCFTGAVITLSLTAVSHGDLEGLHRAILGTAPQGVFDLGVLFAFGAAVVAATEFGPHRGILLGLACGLVMQPAYAPAYALGALVAGGLGGFSKIFSILASGVCALAWGIYVDGLAGLTYLFPPVAVASAILIPAYQYKVIHLPDHLFGTMLTGQRGEWDRARVAIAEESAGRIQRRMHSMAEGMTSMSALLSGVSEHLSKPCRHDYEEMTRAAFEQYCRSCRNRERCHEAQNSKTEPMIAKMTEELLREGCVSAGSVPASLASSCWNMGSILDEINCSASKKEAEQKRGDELALAATDYGLAGELLRQAAKAEASEGEIDDKLSAKLRRVLSYHNFGAASVTVYGQRNKRIFVHDVDLMATRLGGDEIRELFERLTGVPLTPPEFELNGAVLSMRMESVSRYGCRLGMYSCAASQVHRYWQKARDCGADSQEQVQEETVDGCEESGEGAERQIRITDAEPEDVCGDGIAAFEVGGKQYMILSDGMGSGREAAITSGMVVTLLERLIRAGAELDTALKILNGIVRAAGRECSATVDIAQIDLMTGEAKFIKSGAAPSFVLRGGSIFRLQSKTVPIGIIRALDAEMIRFTVEEGDTVVMVSDGAARSYDEAPWLLDLMTYDEGVLRGDERTAAVTIVSEAALRGSMDDITAGIMRIREMRKAG